MGMIIIQSCSTTKRTSRPNATIMTPSEEEVKGVNKGSGKVDTIYWTEVDRTKDYERTIEDLDLDKRPVYKVGLLMPFESKKSTDAHYSDPESKLGRMIHYYGGINLALQQLESEGIALSVQSYDAESGNFNYQLQECRDVDVIIGPRNRDQLATTANFGRANDIPVISPWLSSSKVAKDNPYYIQLIPSVRDHYSRIVNHIKEKYSEDQVFLLGRKDSKDRAAMRYIQTLVDAANGPDNTALYNEFYVDEDSLRIGEEAFDNIFFEDQTTVFVLPNYSFSADEDFVYNCVRKMSGEKGLKNVVLYGMPILLESDKVKFEHYTNLNMRIARSSYVDNDDSAVKTFREAYFEKYNDFPSEDAYKGYDMMLFVGRSMYNYGKRFQFFFQPYTASLLQTIFDVQKVFEPGDDAFDDIQYHQNKHLYILSFEDYRFQKQ